MPDSFPTPPPPVADGTGLPWDVPVDDAVGAIAEARARHGDTFVVLSGTDHYLFTFSPVGVESFYALPEDKPLTCVAYVGGPGAEAFVELVAVGDALPEMPLFLTPEVYVSVPLEATYESAWKGMPAYWRDVLTAAPGTTDGS